MTALAHRLVPSLLLLALVGCGSQEAPTTPTAVDPSADLTTLRIPAGFVFNTTVDVRVNLRLLPATLADGTTARVRVGFPLASGGMDRVLEGWLEADGSFSGVLPVATWRDRLLVEADQPDGVRRLLLPIQSGKVTYPGPTLGSWLTPAANLTASQDGGPMLLPEDLQNYPIAYISHFPSESSYGTLAFEDNWPVKGDYDFNDLVLGYHVVQYRNPAGDIVAMEMFLRPEAAGANFANGFGVRLPVDWRRIISVTGVHSTRLNAEGLEEGQSQAVTIVFDRFSDLSGRTGMLNTGSAVFVQVPEQRVLFKFRTPLKDTDLGTPPFDPFLIVNGDRGREIHLAGKTGTDRANRALSGTGDDRGGYRTGNGLPWAVLLPTDWEWPLEQSPINLGHLEFVSWAVSGGTTVSDWYLPKASNRDYRYLYRRSR